MLNFFSSGKLFLVFGVAISLLSAFSWGLYQQNGKLSQEVLYERSQRAAVSAALESSNKVILDLRERIKTSQIASQALSEANTQLEKDFNAKDAELKSHLGRLEEAFKKKPKLMERLVNKSFNKFIDQVDCNNGNLESCKD